MKHFYTIAAMLSLSFLLIAADAAGEMQRVPYVRESGFKGAEWYHTQARLWGAVVKKNPGNAVAWRNYYLATEYSFWGSDASFQKKRTKLKRILNKMQLAVPETYEFNILAYRYDQGNMAALKKAHQLNPNQPEPYYDFIVQYLLKGDEKKYRDMCEKLYQTGDIPPALLNYNYNMLMSVAPNAILFTNGDNDSYPCWVLQQAKQVRADVSVINVSLLRSNEVYARRMLAKSGVNIPLENLPKISAQQYAAGLAKRIYHAEPDVPVYFAVTIDKSAIKNFSKSLYMTGLAYRYSPERFANVAALKKNWQRFRTDYLQYNWYDENHVSTQAVQQLNMNYVPLLIMLYEEISANKQANSALKYKALAEKISRDAGREDEFEAYLKKNKNR